MALFAARKVAIGIKSVHVALRVQSLEQLGSSIAYPVNPRTTKACVASVIKVSCRIAWTSCMVTLTSLDPMH